LLNLIITPISGPNPMGENIIYDEDFTTLKTEIGKLGDIDYALIEKLSKNLLKEKSKDIRVLCFFSFCCIRNSHWDNVADVFEGFSVLCDQNFDALYPDRPRAKQQAIQWLSETRYNEMASSKKPEEKDYSHILRLQAALTKLQTVLDSKFPGASPFPVGFLSTIITWEKQLKPKAEAPNAPSAGTASTSGQSESMETAKQAQSIGKKTAYFLIEKEPQKIMGYRLMRSLRWDLLEKAPPSENGKTQLAPPSTEMQTACMNALKANDFKAALEKAEIAFTAGANHFWLGLQRITALAGKNLGTQYEPIYKAVLFETGFLIKRIPELLSLSFSDGTPFCDEATKDWIATDVRPLFSESGATSNNATAQSAVENPIDLEKAEAVALAASGKTEQALDLIQNAIRTSISECDKFKRSIILSSLLVTAKQNDIALSILESLSEKINAFNIDKWDPDLAVIAWTALVKALKISKAGKQGANQTALQDKMNSILSKISQIDPKQAFSLNS
jgi:type VI secretion system protein VasJ